MNNTSSRERLLEALASALRSLEGVKYVSRQAITPDLLSDAQLPAIIIDESNARYRWLERHGERCAEVSNALVLDLQVRAKRNPNAPGGNPSTVREAFVAAVIAHLAHHATLTVQLPGEDEPCAHARDVASQFDVQFVAAPSPYARALITIRADTYDHFDSRARTNWTQLIADIGA